MSDLTRQIRALDESLAGFKATELVEWRVGKMANALLAEARKQVPDSPVLAAIDDFKSAEMMTGPDTVNDANVGTFRATLRQVLEALPRSSPPPPSRGGLMNEPM